MLTKLIKKNLHKSILSSLNIINKITYNNAEQFCTDSSQQKGSKQPQSPQGQNQQLNIKTLQINPYLKQNLLKNHIYQLKKFQYETLQKLSSSTKENNNKSSSLFINSCTGSGKTLAYLLPILNQLINQRTEEINNNKNQNKANDGIQYNSRRTKHGAVILTLNKQLCLQIYKTIRLLDPLQYLDVKRTGPITHYIPVITQLVKSNIGISHGKKSPQPRNPPTKQQSDLIDSKINTNLVNTIKWTKTDILISTPQLLYNLMGMAQNRNKNKQNIRDNIATNFVVIDQADILLELDKNVSKYVYKIIQDIKINNRIIQKQQHVQQDGQKKHKKSYSPNFIISTSSFPIKIQNNPYLEQLSKKFPNLKQISSIQLQHQIPKQIDLYFVEVDDKREDKNIEKDPAPEDQYWSKFNHVYKDKFNDALLRRKLFYIQDIIRNKLGIQRNGNIEQNKNLNKQRFIIFCNNKNSINNLQTFFNQSPILRNIPCDIYHASLDTNQRSNTLNRFQTGKSSILISTDLGSRGLDFQIPVNCIIEFQMAQNVTGWLNRVGRTGRNGVKGMVITFVENCKEKQNNSMLWKHIQQLVESGGKLDQVFSRKRSYSKLYKNKQSSNKNDD